MKSYKDLIVWQKSIQFVKDAYKATASFPKEESFGLISQIRRAAISVPSNIAEGSGRSGRTEYIRFLNIARGSCYELETQLIISLELDYLNELQYRRLASRVEELSRMLTAQIQKLSAPSTKYPEPNTQHPEPRTQHPAPST